MEDLRYQWKGGDDNGVDVSFSVGLPEFMQVKLFEGIEVAMKFSHQNSRISLDRAVKIETSLSTGNYSRLNARFHLERAYWYHYMTIYVPLCMAVICSWMALWMDRKYRHEM